MDLKDRESLALKVREHIIRMAGGGGCFIGASLSCVEILVHLYTRVLRVTPDTAGDPARDYLFLSKGHDVPALYGLLAELGFFSRERLQNHLDPDDHIYWHPNRSIPGIEFHSGSLGHLLSVAIGVALDMRMRGTANRVFVVLGDGELNEGSVWEACLVASALRLSHLTAVVDRNRFQANMETEDLIPLEPLEDKFRAFGWEPRRLDGHDFEALDRATRDLPDPADRPRVLIADTVRGKGLPSLEGRADRWFVKFTQAEVDDLLLELHGRKRADLESEAQHVR